MSYLIIYSQAGCTKCAAVKSRLKTARLRFSEVDLGQEQHRKNVLLMLGYRSLPIFSLPDERAENITADLDEALNNLKRLCEAGLRKCENFFSPCSDIFEEHCNYREKRYLQEQIAAIQKVLEAKNG